MSADEAWRQAIARAEVLLQEGEAAEDMSVIADAVSGFNAALKLASRASSAAGLGEDAEPAECRTARSGRAHR